MIRDKAGRQYWDDGWSRSERLPAADPSVSGVNNYPVRLMDRYFHALLSQHLKQHSTVLEVGCARSIWLPYLARRFGVSVSGLDYSSPGCERAREILAASRIDAPIWCGDLFDPPPELVGSFDCVMSFGLVEHFERTDACLLALARMVRPGGTLLTSVPNMCGVNGVLQKMLNRQVYEIHVPLDSTSLATAHAAAGLEVLDARYLMPLNLAAVNLDPSRPRMSTALMRLFSWVSKAIWLVDERVMSIPAMKVNAAFVSVIARKGFSA